MEGAVAQGHIGYTEAVADAGVCAGAAYVRVGSGVACFSGAESPFSQVVGWGFDETESSVNRSLA